MEKYREIDLLDVIFPSDNELEIPTLRLDMQAEKLTRPFYCWGEQKRIIDLQHCGSLHFYTDDYRYAKIWDKPSQIIQCSPLNIVEPNYSLYSDMPVAFGLQRIYQKRWIARTMQEHGIRILVDLNVASNFYKLNMLGVPLGWRAFATRGYSDRLHNLEYEYSIAKDWANGKAPLFVIYGGGEKCRQFARKHNCIYANTYIHTKSKLEAKKQIDENIAFLSKEFSLQDQVDIRQKQIEDFGIKEIEENI